ncbi:MAG: hypothetical protein A2785_02175 [Candidatus Chisholmbacteria bacterium RIFCSPHIGHO2_01_FULL_49_18]|uniref:Uncharacterized protein n=2 Tax=Candidatus Chisholmiibacteriota TaxID=1817900 RepID=A0A1G1VNE8_9BACT|nr:MAG: hypothetical protein A2785_02175 [Candidatus Chisholmbacteria bacterium RIFCSPHIGHO2_01_FULL_49_18]OGY21527.1 MAG: hypothetical protein A3A65_05385 [Candidatus Chisholmbacteria bacterium RIFCSPLOWO2_01_FULL_49_14]
MSWNLKDVIGIVAGVIFARFVMILIRKHWGETLNRLEEALALRIEAIGEWLVDTAEFVRAAYVRIRQVYSPTQLWLLVHLFPLTWFAAVIAVNAALGLRIPIRSLFIAAAILMALEAGLPMYLMRFSVKSSLLFAVAASIVVFKPWESQWLENQWLLAVLTGAIGFAYSAILLWHPDEILKRIRRELGLPFEEGEFLAKLKTPEGFLLILADSLIRIGKWVTEFIQDWYLQVNLKQVILMPFNLIAVMGVALLLQYPQYPPLEEFAPKAVGLTGLLMLYWAAIWTLRWILKAGRRFMSIMSYGREAGYSGNVLGGLLTISAIVSLGLGITSIGYRYVPTVVGEGTPWLYAEALPYIETVGTVAARIISAFA